MTAPRPFSGPRKRLTKDESREHLLQEAQKMVAETGLTVGLDHLRFEAVVARSGVARSVAYRLYENKEQFYGDLLLRLAESSGAGAAAYDATTVELATQTLTEHLPNMKTADDRWRAALDASRVGAEENFRTLTTSPAWSTYIALNATALSMPEGDLKKRLVGALREAEESFIVKMAEFYQQLSAAVGLQLRPEYGGDYRVLAVLGASLVEGLGLRNLVNSDVLHKRFDTLTGLGNIGAELHDWSLSAVGFTAILTTMMEIDPEWTPKALALWQQDTEATPSDTRDDEGSGTGPRTG